MLAHNVHAHNVCMPTDSNNLHNVGKNKRKISIGIETYQQYLN